MRIRSVTVEPDAVEAIVEFDSGEAMRTSDARDVPARMLAALPGLRGHRCDNGDGRSFVAELPDTELAHLLEHAALEVMALAGSPATLRGDTSWDFARDGRGVFRVRVAYDDDRVAIGSLAAAEAIVRWAIEGGDAPDPATEATRLASLRRR